MGGGLTGYALASLRHQAPRTLAQVAAIAVALALLGSVFIFIGGSLGAMTRVTAAGVGLDWQAAAPDQAGAVSLAADLGGRSGIAEAAPAATAPFDHATHAMSTSSATSAAGTVLAVPANYLGALHPFHLLQGRLDATGVVLSQPLASTLQAQVGDSIGVAMTAAGPAATVTVTGIGIVDAPELLFQPTTPLATAAPPAPPTEVVIVSIPLFQARLAGLLPTPAPPASGVPTPAGPIQWEVHAQVAPQVMPGDPATAQVEVDTFRNSIERSLPGRLNVIDNLSATLGVAAEQALYAQVLFIFLALPGVLIALWLAYYAAAAGDAESQRQLALLRTRGAVLGDLVGAALVEGGLIGLAAAALGLLGALAATSAAIPGLQPPGPGRLGATALILLGVGIGAGIGARLVRVLRAHKQVVQAGRARSLRPAKPLWARLYLDVLALVASAGVFALDRATGLSAVITPDSNPTFALSLYSFLAPCLLWIGATLLVVRLGSRAIEWTASRFPAAGATSLAPFLIRSAAARAGAINRAVVLVALLLSFGVSLGLFAATYQQQAQVDAQLSLGADVVVAAPSGAALQPSTLTAIANVNGVAAVSPLIHTYGYVGPDLQDLFGVDPNSIGRSTTLRDSYVSGGSMAQLLAGMRSRPDGILVSAETIKDYGLATGDLLQLRLLDQHSNTYQVVPFHVLGVVSEFPAAPKDSFMVANLDYVLGSTHASGADTAFVATSGDPVQVGAAIAQVVGPSGATVQDITRQLAKTKSSLTTVNLSGISLLEEGFTVLIALVSIVLFAALAANERRHELALMAAMGAGLRVLGAFLWSEAVLVTALATVLAGLLGTALAVMLVAILTHLFDPPPDYLALPWSYLLTLLGVAAAGTVAGGLAGATAVGRLPLSALLRER